MRALLLLMVMGASPAAGKDLEASREPRPAPLRQVTVPDGPLDVYQRPGSPRTTIRLKDGTIINGYRSHNSKRSDWTWPGGRRLDCYDNGTRMDCR
jgi:hypothetical protein